MSSSTDPNNNNQVTNRPWGSFECILPSMTNYQVKRLVIHHGQCISLQKHEHRSETWCVVEGTGSAIVDEAIISLEPGSVVQIPKGAIHRLSNFSVHPKTKQNLVVIEIQRGDYLGEDDIVRLEDAYGR